jgi:ankyrin repeat protein
MFRTRAPAIGSMTPLHIAACFGLIDVAEQLLSKDPFLMDYSIDGYWTALRWATITQQSAMVLYLVVHGAEIELTDDEGNNVFMWALGHDEDISSLGNLDIRDCSIHIGDIYRYRSFEEIAQRLDVATSEPRTNLEILHFLVTNTTSIHTQNMAGLSTLAMAARHHHLGLVCHLLDRGADTNSTDTIGMTPLLWALQPDPKRDLTVGDITIQGAACVHIGPHIIIDSLMPIHQDSGDIMIDPASYESMLLLLVGDQLDARDRHGRTALSLAAGKGLSTLATMLLEGGADVTTVDHKDTTAYGRAVLHPAAHRTHIGDVTVDGPADVLIGVQYEYRDLDLRYSRSFPTMDESRALLCDTLLEHIRRRRKNPSSSRSSQVPHAFCTNEFRCGNIHASSGSSNWVATPFALFSHNDKGTRSIEWRGLDWEPATQFRYGDIHASGGSRAAFGIATKITYTEPLTCGSPVTWMTAFSSEELRARRLLIRDWNGSTSIMLEPEHDPLSVGEQHVEFRREPARSNAYDAYAEWLRWNRELEERSHQLPRLNDEMRQILSRWREGTGGQMWAQPRRKLTQAEPAD